MTKGERIKARREALGLSVGELAERLNKNRQPFTDMKAAKLRTCP